MFFFFTVPTNLNATLGNAYQIVFSVMELNTAEMVQMKRTVKMYRKLQNVLKVKKSKE